MRHSLRAKVLMLSAVFCAAPATWAIDWDKTYEGEVMPDLATPAWNHGGAGGTTTLGLDGIDTFLGITNGSPAANNSWDAPTSDPILSNTSSTAFEYNDPDVAGETWAIVQGQAFTIEWRMRVNGPETLAPSGQTGVKLTYMGYPSSKYARFDWYFDAVNHRLPNNQQTWGSHAGKTGPEGSEADLSNDGFPNINLGEWHVYKVTSVNMSGKWHRELWLDGAYVGRWWDDKTSTSGPELKMRANNTSLANTSVDFDYVRWAGKPDGQYVRPVLCPVAPRITAVNPSQIQPPAQQTQLTIGGTDLGEFLTEGSGVALVQGATSIPGTGLAMNGSDLVATFDLTDAPEGYYDVQGTQAGGCSNPIKLLLSVRYKPGVNLLTNSVFEGGRDPWTACQYKTAPEFGYSSHTGVGYISAASNWGETVCTAEQTVAGLSAGPADLTLSLWAVVWDNSANDPGHESSVRGEIVVDGNPVAATTLDSIVGPQSTWENLTVQWTGELTESSTVLVRLTLDGDGQGGSGWGLVNVDDVELVKPAPPVILCNTPFADTDGDGDVDQVDFAAFQACYTGEGGTVASGCGCFDRDHVNGIDSADLTQFEQCATGPGIQAGPGCGS
jgi:hypothetical protein